MEYSDHFNPSNENDYDAGDFNKIDNAKKMDRGYNRIFRMRERPSGLIKQTKIEFYTSSDVGCNIRDGESGEYYSSKVGSADEDLFFKVILATGECKSKNGSSTLFYTSPQHYMSHFNCELDPEFISQWELKRNNRQNELEVIRQKNALSDILVR
jgi:hypothetical protein